MAKRTADDQLTSDNWEQDTDEKEDRGVFRKASVEKLKDRSIKKAKRSMLHANGNSSSAQGGLFAGLKLQGLSSSFPSSTISSGFSLTGAAVTTGAGSQTDKPLLFPTTSQALSTGIGLGMGRTGLSTGNTGTGKTGLGTGSTGLGSGPGKEDHFLKELRLLNTSVSKWITRHLQENPYVDLSPVFNDYFQHLSRISEDEPTAPSSDPFKQTLPILDPPSNTTPTEYTPIKSLSSEASSTSDPPTDRSDPSDEQTSQEEDASEQPPGEEDCCSPQEEGAPDQQASSSPAKNCLLSVRCKLFYKKGSSYADLGVGQLKVEERPSGVRLLLRNDTKLGNILLNVHLKGEIPVTLQKNHVVVVCTPNPPLSGDDSSATTYLIRVKDTGRAQELHSIIKKHLC